MVLRSLAASAALCSCHAQDATVTLPFGHVRGNALTEAWEFLGVPYASKPERFAKPVAWSEPFVGGELDAKRYSVACVQPTGQLDHAQVPMSEDCLHLNVYVPLPPPRHGKASWPVMVWVHGGGLQTGSAMSPVYNGSRLVAREHVVVVAVNYRLQVLGFAPVRLADGSVSANRGFQDQQEALRWTRAQITAFGGDASSITIFGESAGAKSAHSHVVLPGSAGLFDRAIAESSGIAAYVTVDQGLASSDALARSVSCHDAGDLTCLRNADAEQLLAGFQQVDPTVVGDETLPLPPLELIASGRFNKVPVMTSTNANEGNLFIGGLSVPYAVAQCAIEKHFPKKSDREAIQDFYPSTNVDWFDNRGIISDLISDMRFRCGDRSFMLALASAGVDGWMASFRRHSRCATLPGVPHSADIGYVFEHLEDTTSPIMNSTCRQSKRDLELSRKVGSIWADFARSGRPAWPKYSPDSEQLLKIDLGLLSRMELDTGYRRAECEALQAIGYAASANISMSIISSVIECQRSMQADAVV